MFEIVRHGLIGIDLGLGKIQGHEYAEESYVGSNINYIHFCILWKNSGWDQSGIGLVKEALLIGVHQPCRNWNYNATLVLESEFFGLVSKVLSQIVRQPIAVIANVIAYSSHEFHVASLRIEF